MEGKQTSGTLPRDPIFCCPRRMPRPAMKCRGAEHRSSHAGSRANECGGLERAPSATLRPMGWHKEGRGMKSPASAEEDSLARPSASPKVKAQGCPGPASLAWDDFRSPWRTQIWILRQISRKNEFCEFGVGSIRRDFPWAPAGGGDFRPGPAGSGGGPAAPGRPRPGRPGQHKNTRLKSSQLSFNRVLISFHRV